MYCGKCGFEIEIGHDFCGKCGNKVGSVPEQPRPNTVLIREKSEGGAAVLSFLLPGLGQIYVGKIARGLCIMLAGIALWFFGLVLMFAVDDLAGLLILSIFLTIASLALLIWNIFDAYNLAKEYNNRIRATGNRPW